MATKKTNKTQKPKNLEEMFQRSFEIQKHFDNQQECKDTCGTYEFCGECDKNLDNPCAKAHYSFGKNKNIVKNGENTART